MLENADFGIQNIYSGQVCFYSEFYIPKSEM